MITARCTSCGQEVTVADKYAGKRGQCRQCGSAVMIPQAPPDLSFLGPQPESSTGGRSELVSISSIVPADPAPILTSSPAPHYIEAPPPEPMKQSNLRAWLIGSGATLAVILTVIGIYLATAPEDWNGANLPRIRSTL